MKHRPKVAICIPHNFPMIPSPFFDSMMLMEKPDFIYIREYSCEPIDMMRNNLVKTALSTDVDHIIFMDSDMVYHPKTITQLLSHKLPVAGALCYRRYPPFDPILYKGTLNKYVGITEWKENSLVEVDATGTGCLLFDSNIFKKMKYPWFQIIDNPDTEIGGVVGEDINFCYKLKKEGYKIFVDTSIPAGHLSTMVIDENAYKLYKFLRESKANNSLSEEK